MRRVGAFVIAGLWIASALASPAMAARPDGDGEPPPFPREGNGKHARDSWIVLLRAGSDAAADAPGLAQGAGGRVGHVYTHAIRGFQFKGSAKAAEALLRNPNVKSVTKDSAIFLSDTTPPGLKRIGAAGSGSTNAHAAGYRGSGARIAVIDTGIDLNHPDLAAAIDAGSGLNCFDAAQAPNDGHGHGTHVAGTAAAPDNGTGVVGVAPAATLVPIKVFDDAGNSSEAHVLCGLDRVVDLNTDADPVNDIDVANMSFGDPRPWGSCAADPLHGAICAADAAGVVLIGGAGNNAANGDTFVPAAFPEVVSVSAMADFDGVPGGAGGCPFVPSVLWFQCDDAFAFFSNYGSSVDVIAPGVEIFSTWAGGGYQNSTGTSMATPHVAGVAALVSAAKPGLAPSEVRAILAETGDTPSGIQPGSGCGSAGAWSGDPDGIPEPLVNAYRAALRADDPSLAALPDLTLAPAAGANLTGTAQLTSSATHASGIAGVQFFVDGTSIGTDTTLPYERSWDTTATFDGVHSLSARAVAANGLIRCVANSVTSGVTIKGDWVGSYGANGYALGGWNGADGTDLVALPNATLTLEQGLRYSWAAPTTDVRALEAVDQSFRRATGWYHATQVRARLNFTAAYTGTLHVYGFDWENAGRRMNVTVTDGTTTRTVAITTSFRDGAWMHFPVSVPAGGIVRITADKTAANNAVIAGLFLGGAGTPPAPNPSPSPTPAPTPTPTPIPTPTPTATPTPPPYEAGVKGDWVGVYGSDGYVQSAWVGPGSSDRVALPNATLTLEQGLRYSWAAPTTDVRALEAVDQSFRRATGWYHATQVRARLNFTAAYTGTLHVYGFDWENAGRRMNVTVTDGTTTRTVAITTSFRDGAWMHFPVSVPAGGIVRITADKTAANNAIIAGLFLGGAGTPPAPTLVKVPTVSPSPGPEPRRSPEPTAEPEANPTPTSPPKPTAPSTSSPEPAATQDPESLPHTDPPAAPSG